MNFEYGEKTAGLLAKLEAFMDAHVYPNESLLRLRS
jgi:acyl-CoA dehydrogenase